MRGFYSLLIEIEEKKQVHISNIPVVCEFIGAPHMAKKELIGT